MYYVADFMLVGLAMTLPEFSEPPMGILQFGNASVKITNRLRPANGPHLIDTPMHIYWEGKKNQH